MLFKGIRLIFVVLIAGILIAVGAMQLQPVKEFVVAKGVDLFARHINQHLEVDDVDLLLPFEIKITHPQILTLEGRKAFEASSILVRINPYSFFIGEIHIQSLVIEDPVFHFEENNEPFFIQEVLSSLQFAITINNLQLVRYKLPSVLEGTLEKGIYDIDAKIEYDPKAGYFFTKGKAKEINTLHSIEGNVAFYTDGDIGFLGIEADKTEGILLGTLSNFKGHVSSQLSGSYNDWKHFLNDAGDVSNYRLAGKARSSWTHHDERGDITGSTSTSIELGNGNRFRLTDLEIKTPLFDLASTFSLSQEGSLKGTSGSIQVNDIGEIFSFIGVQNELEAKGPATFNFAMDGTIDAPEGDLEVYSNKLEVFEKSLEKIDGKISFIKEESYQGALGLHLEVEQKPFLSTLFFSTDLESHLLLHEIALDLPWGQGKGAISWENKNVEARLSAHISDLGFAKTILDREIEGSLDASISYSTLDETPKLQIHLDSKKLTLNRTTAENFTLVAEADGRMDRFSFGGKVFAKKVLQGEEIFNDVDLRVDHSLFGDESPFQLKFSYHDEPFALDGSIQSDFPENMRLEIAHFSGKFRGEPLLLKEPARITTDLKSFNATPLNFSFGKGSLLAQAHMQDSSWHFFFRFKEIPCGIFPFEEFFNQRLEGDAEGEALFYGTADALEGKIWLDVHDLFAKEDIGKKIPVLRGSLTAFFEKNRMDCQGEIFGFADTPLDFKFSIPLSLSLKEPFFALDMNGPLAANVKAEGSLTPLLELFIMDAAYFSGDGKIQMNIGGTLTNPDIKGSFALRNGVFEINELGTIITNIQADLRGNGTHIELTRIVGSDGGSGVIEGSGSLLLSKKEGFPFRTKLQLRNAKPIHIDMLKGAASGTLTWHGTIDGSIVEGNLDIQNGELLLPKKIPETAVSYPVRYVNNEKNPRKPTEVVLEGTQEIPIELKIQVATGDALSITDEDLKSTWKGKIDLSGKIQKPILSGEIKLRSGDYILNGKRFDLSQGRVSFNGDIEKKSNVYVSLTREIQGYEVEIILKGHLKDPEILLRSHPALPKQQVLSLILFGQTSSEISELQEEQLEQSLSNLTSGSSKKDDTLTKFQKSLGIDHIDFMRSNESTSQVCIRLSKYISRGVMLSVYRDVAEDINAVALEAEIHKNFKAQIEAQDNSEGQFSILWKKSY